MTTLAACLVALVALMHIGFLILEMVLWTRPVGMRIFGMNQQQAEATRVLAANQGLYNGFLAAGLIWSMLAPNPDFARQLAMFFLGCVIVAAAYGAWSVKPRILLVQGGPAILALLATILS